MNLKMKQWMMEETGARSEIEREPGVVERREDDLDEG